MQSALQIMIPQAAAASAAGVAAFVDHRTGRIPNWLTFPSIVLGLAYGFWTKGALGLAESAAGMIVCGVPALVVYKTAGMPGGDLKLFAALGSLLGPTMGLEVELFALIAASLMGVVVLARRGKLGGTLLDALYTPVNRFLPEKKRRTVSHEAADKLRLGPFVLFGTLVAIARHSRQWMP